MDLEGSDPFATDWFTLRLDGKSMTQSLYFTLIFFDWFTPHGQKWTPRHDTHMWFLNIPRLQALICCHNSLLRPFDFWNTAAGICSHSEMYYCVWALMLGDKACYKVSFAVYSKCVGVRALRKFGKFFHNKPENISLWTSLCALGSSHVENLICPFLCPEPSLHSIVVI